MDAAGRFYATLQIYSLMPFILLFGNFLVWGVYMWLSAACNPSIGGNRFLFKRLVNRASISIGICIWLIYPSITGFLLQSTNCFGSLSTEGPEDEIVYRLRIAPDVVCSDSKYVMHLLVFVIPGLILYNFVIPFLAIRKMNKYGRAMYVSGYKPESEQSVKDR